MSVFLLIVGIVLFLGLIIVHEFGHFIAARRGGVEVEEFGIFFPPTLYKKRMPGGWNFKFNLLPLGGYVKLKGEHDTDTAPGSYGAASLRVKTQIMAAGVFMNLVAAYLLLMILAWIGMPQLLSNQFTVKSDTHVIRQANYVVLDTVEKGSPAAKAGLKSGDEILKLGPAGHLQPIPTLARLQQVTKRYAGQSVKIDYQRNGHRHAATAILNSAASQRAAHPPVYLGASIVETNSAFKLQRSTWSAPIVAGGLIGQFTEVTFVGLGHALSGLGSLIAGTVTHNSVARQHGQSQAAQQVGGPVLIVYVLHLLSGLGFQFILLIIALVSLTLAIMNFLPIPALDGGRLWITIIARLVFRRPLTAAVEERVTAAGFIVLFGLFIVITVVDILRVVHHTF